jgi:hypothetical protein
MDVSLLAMDNTICSSSGIALTSILSAIISWCKSTPLGSIDVQGAHAMRFTFINNAQSE